ncbi:MAG: response regulator [Williamsia sp.]|nr:response regulator [Williamsia sp.]
MIDRTAFTLRLFIGVFCLACFRPGAGQDITFNHLRVENGLLNNAVLSIAQDTNGFMWFGTRMGLNRYDGVRFRAYQSNGKDSTSISDNHITSLLCDSKHDLWIGSGGGLDRYDARKDVFERIKITGGHRVNIFCIYEDRKGNMWIGSSNGLHLLTDRKKNQFRSFYAGTDGIGGNSVRDVFEDRAGNLWMGTDNGLTRMRWSNGKPSFETFRNVPGKAGVLNANSITTIAEDATGLLWIGTQNNGLDLYDPSTHSFTSFTHSNTNTAGIVNNNIRKILFSRSGRLWVGTQEGLSIIDPATKAIRSYQYDAAAKKGLSQNSIYSLFEDANHSVWVGTYFGGVNTFYSCITDFTSFQNNENRSSLSNNVVSSMVEDERHNLWIGTEGGGINYFDRPSGLFTVYKNKLNDPLSLGSNLVKVVYLDKDGNLWAGTHGGGLNVLDRNKKKFRRFLYKENDPASLTGEVTSLLEDGKGRFWAATNSGLKLFRRNGTDLEPVAVNKVLASFPRLNVSIVYQDAQQTLWIGAQPGLYRIADSTIKAIDTNCNVNCIRSDAKGNIWLGLNNGGIARYDSSNERLVRYTGNRDLLTTNVIALLDDDKGTLWLSTDNGLIKFNPEQGRFQTYTVSDGLAGNEFNYGSYLKDSRGELFFGGFNGVTHFFPGKIETNSYRAPVVFTGLKLFDTAVGINGEDKLLKESITYAEALTFDHDQDVFTLEFALLNFIKSGKNKYAYKLTGFDKNWNETTVPAATYTHLPPGTYTFMVRGANNDGIWSGPVSLKINMLPPFWLTWWAYCVYVLAFTAVLFLVTRFFFLRALLKKEDELHRAKLNFFTNISHEIRTHLTLIMVPVDKMLEADKTDRFLNQQLTNIKENASRLLKLVSELMDFRKAETRHLTLHIARQNLIPFLQEIYGSFQDLSLAKNIKISFVHDRENVPVYFDKGQLEKVFFNLLGNAFKFTPEGGRICLNVEQNENRVKISVTDNGRGIAPQYREKLFTNFFQVADHGLQNTGYGIGLALSKNIVELHKGSIDVESEPSTEGREGHTCFTVILLKGNKHFEGTAHMQEDVAVPQAVAQEAETLPQAPSLLNGETSDKQFTLLIAEDNDELRPLIKETFQDRYNILECENGLQAWKAASEQIPDLVISDVMMPEMNGFELCEKLKTDERTSHIPVMLLTAKSAQSDLISGLETGADVYITKPFSTKALALNAHNLLTSRERLRQKFSRQIGAEPTPGTTTIEGVKDSFANAVDKEFLEKVVLLVEEHIDNPEFGVAMLSRKCAMSQPVLYKKLKAVTGLSVNDFIKSIRLKTAARLLLQKKLTVYEVAYAIGYSDRKYFSQEFKKQFGKTPSEFATADLDK